MTSDQTSEVIWGRISKKGYFHIISKSNKELNEIIEVTEVTEVTEAVEAIEVMEHGGS